MLRAHKYLRSPTVSRAFANAYKKCSTTADKLPSASSAPLCTEHPDNVQCHSGTQRRGMKHKHIKARLDTGSIGANLCADCELEDVCRQADHEWKVCGLGIQTAQANSVDTPHTCTIRTHEAPAASPEAPPRAATRWPAVRRFLSRTAAPCARQPPAGNQNTVATHKQLRGPQPHQGRDAHDVLAPRDRATMNIINQCSHKQPGERHIDRGTSKKCPVILNHP